MMDYSKLTVEDFQEGQLLLIDKPLTWTSFDAVAKIRYAIRKKFNLKKLKVGHAGTLDPLATGLLIICTGRFTKRIADLTVENKTYTGTFKLGSTTPSYDLETETENHRSTDHITEELVQEAVSKMSGPIMQMPPIFSAKKVDGKRAYISARKGKDVRLEARPVIISKFEVDTSCLPEVKFEIECSKGTYIRSIARDLGEALECGAHLSELRRSKIGDYSVENATDPIEFQRLVQDNNEDV
ncbi:MAG TPA: tRNA pseudouridine(55) synthase TruB [Cryomorphaceae bacterium]|nr:tRNA pseudouridine(55) synthase TruB [Cryomorphaceae bacterium]